MKLLQIFRFEAGYQLRRLSTWLFAVVLATIAALFVRGNFLADAVYDDFYVNSPFVISFVTVFGSLFWLLIAAPVTGAIAARDWQTGMQALMFTTPVSKAQYLGGRFLAALSINAGLQLAVPLGALLAMYAPGVDAQVIGSFRPGAFLQAYAGIALPNAFIGTAVQFAAATLSRRGIGSYLGSILLFVTIYGGVFAVYYFFNRQELAILFDAFAQLTLFDLTLKWTPFEKSTRMLSFEGALLWRRLLWIGIACGVLSITFLRFRFTHHVPRPLFGPRRIRRIADASADRNAGAPLSRLLTATPRFGTRTTIVQLLTVTRNSFRVLAFSWTGIPVLIGIAALAVLVTPQNLENMGTPLLPRTGYLLSFLTAPLSNFLTPWIILPLLIIFYAGTLVWRERDARIEELTDAAPVANGTLFWGKFFGLAALLAVWMLLLFAAGVLIQIRMGYHHHEPALFIQVLFGLQLPEYLLFALLALAVQSVIPLKYVGHLTALLLYVFILFAARLGVTHHLLVYGSGPAWSYSGMRGFGASIGPWLWFKAYWAAWALLIGGCACLFRMRGQEQRFIKRAQAARARLTRRQLRLLAAGAATVLCIGGFIFYNTNVLNEYHGAEADARRRANYEQRYGRFKDVLQPSLSKIRLRLELYPATGRLEGNASYVLVNHSTEAIDTIHLATVRSLFTGTVRFNRDSRLLIDDGELGHRTYQLAKPLQPGDTVQLSFAVSLHPRGFGNKGRSRAIVANGTYFTGQDLLPAIGYQERRELVKPAERRVYGLPPRAIVPALADAADEDVTGEAGHRDGGEGVVVETVIGTESPQTAIAPGTLQRAWTERRGKHPRAYFHYLTEQPVGDEFAFFSAVYQMRELAWRSSDSSRSVPIQIYYDPAHTANVDRLLRSAYASLRYYSREFGPYPFPQLRLVENPVRQMGAHAEAAVIDYGQGFALFNPEEDPNGLDFPFAIMAHEVAHQWWGAQLSYALAEGAGLLTESPAWYSAMGVVKETYGEAQLRRLMRFFRQPYPIPQIHQSVPLLRGRDPYAAYRKGPFALYAMSEEIGMRGVNSAYRALLQKHLSGMIPAPTSLDLYRELQAVTPDTLKPRLHDLFAANTYWDLKTENAAAVQLRPGLWRVDLQIRARKFTSDTSGTETEQPMNEWVYIGVFAPTGEGSDYGKTLYLRKHRIHSGRQAIQVPVPQKPADAGVDPYHLLIETDRYDNVERVKS